MDSTGVDIQALAERATGRGRANICWFAKQEAGSHIDEYMSALEVIETHEPGKVNKQEVHRTLNNELGGLISMGTVARHIRGECNCGQFERT